ncbi:MAG: DUF2505 domain-containing protein [Mobilicoccus sp.]|nr:DUF2505 domain-containing protein [Mobilicoccus sp.]
MTTREIAVVLRSPIDVVWARLIDPETTARRAALDGADGRVTRHAVGEGDGAELIVGIDTDVPESWMPPMVRSMMGTGRGPGLPVVRRLERWTRHDDAIDGDMEIVVQGVPARSGATMSIEARESGAEAFYEVSLTVSVPVVGRAVEQAVSERIIGVLGAELDVLDGY